MSNEAQAIAAPPLSWEPTRKELISWNGVDYSGRPLYPDELIDRICEIVRGRFGTNVCGVVDVGCGNGRATLRIAKERVQHLYPWRRQMREHDRGGAQEGPGGRRRFPIFCLSCGGPHFRKRLPRGWCRRCHRLHGSPLLRWLQRARSSADLLAREGIVIQVDGGGPLHGVDFQKAMGDGSAVDKVRNGSLRAKIAMHMEWSGFKAISTEKFPRTETYTKEQALASVRTALLRSKEENEESAKLCEQYFETRGTLTRQTNCTLTVWEKGAAST